MFRLLANATAVSAFVAVSLMPLAAQAQAGDPARASVVVSPAPLALDDPRPRVFLGGSIGMGEPRTGRPT